MTRVFQILAFIFVMASGGELCAQVDEFAFLLRDKRPNAIRWENVEGRRLWRSGKKPHYDFASGVYEVHLNAGEEVVIFLPAYSMARIGANESATLDALRVSLSRGDGLFRPVQAREDTGLNALLVNPLEATPQLLRVAVPKERDAAHTISLFVSRRIRSEPLLPYFEEAQVEKSATVKLTRTGKAGYERFSVLDPEKPVSFRVKGPARLMLETRLLYPKTESQNYQDYRLTVSMDESTFQSFEIITSVEFREQFSISGEEFTVGRKRDRYLLVPAGEHKLTAMAELPLLFRVRKLANVYAHISEGEAQELFLEWEEGQSKLPEIRARVAELSRSFEKGLLEARYNGEKESALRALAVQERLFHAYPDWPELNERARASRFYRTFYRELTPEGSKQALIFQNGSFMSPVLKDLGETDGELYLAAAHVEDHAHLVSYGGFTEIPPGEDSPLRYSLPERYSDSTLRVALLDETETSHRTIWLQYDNHPPFEVTFAREHARPAEEFKAPLAAGILGRDLISTATFSPIVYPSVAELSLPSQVNEVRVWLSDVDENAARPLLALHYRASREYALSETRFRTLKEKLPENQSLYTIFEELLGSDISDIHFDGTAKSELKNHLLPFILYLRAKQMTYAKGLHCEGGEQNKLLTGSCSAELARALRLSERDSVESIALLQGLSRSPKLACRTHALQARTEELLKLKEFFLAESLLRKDLLTSCNRETQKTALSELKKYYVRFPEAGGVSDLLAALVAIHPSKELLGELGEVLFNEGDYYQSLQAFLLAGEDTVPGALLLEAALGSGWYGLLYELLGERPESKTILRNYFEEAIRLRAKLHGSLQERVQAVYELEQFPRHRPYQKRFALSPQLFSSSSGAALVYATQRNQYGRYFTITQDVPATLEVLGPVTLRFEFRPLHEERDLASSDSLISDLITVTGTFGERKVSVSNNTVSPGLTLVGSPDLVGMAEYYQLSLGPGLHQLSVSSRERPFLLRAYSSNTDATHGILPKLSKEYVRSILCERDTLSDPAGTPGWMKVPAYLSQSVHRKSLRLPASTLMSPDCTPELYRLDSIDRLRMELRLGELSDESKRQKEKFLAREDVGVEEKQLFLFQLGERAHSVDAGRFARAEMLAASLFENPEPALPDFAQFEEIFSSAASPSLEKLRWSFLKHYKWQVIESVEQSAGVRLLEFETLGAESPEGRLREGLLSPLSHQESRLSYRSNVIVSVVNASETTTELLVSQETLGIPEKKPVTLFYSVDDEVSRSLPISSEKLERVSIKLGPGKHFVRLWCPDLSPTTFVRIRHKSGASDQTPQLKKRRFYVATRDEPTRYIFSGSKIIRIDKITDGVLRSEQRVFGPGVHELTVAPTGEAEESLVRLFERVPVVDGAKLPGTQALRLPAALSSPPGEGVSLFSFHYAEPTEFVDELSLGGQEDGTWSFRFGAVRRRIFEEAENKNVEQFLELGFTYRYFDDTHSVYSTSDLFFRPHEDLAPSFGAEQYFDFTPHASSWSFTGKGYGYAQMASEDLGESHRDLEWHIGGFGTVRRRYDLHLRSSHTPSLTLFGRELSQGDDARFLSRSLDQDVFTDYKVNHRYGLRVGELFIYEVSPSAQALFQAGLSSNEDFNIFSPDSLSLRAGANSIFNLVEGGLYYRLNHFIDDSDRSNSSTRHAIAAELDLRSWESAPNRLGLKADLRYDFDADELSAALFFEFDLSNGRILTDFRPGDIRYRSIREHVAGIRHPRNRKILEER